ncbi:MAG TPA: FG-GAP-like repeat-containing protein, partial [Pyrinomonadaceae bacterium]
MLKRSLFVAIALCLCALFPVARRFAQRSTTASAQAQSSPDAREAAYRANNLGVALLEQFKHAEAAEQFRRALKLDPQLALAHINLAVALYNVPDADAAARAASDALALAPGAPQPLYLQALIARSRNQTEEAVAAFRRVLEVDPRDTGANVNLGQLHAQQRSYAEAERAFRAALDSEPYNSTALYGLANVLLRSNQREEGQRLLQQFQTLRQTGAGTSIGTNYLEQGRYAEAVASTGAEAGLVDQNVPQVTFTDATASLFPATEKNAAGGARARAPQTRGGGRGKTATRARGGGAGKSNPQPRQKDEFARAFGAALLFDYDGDGDLDLYDGAPGGQRLYRNDGGKFLDVTARAGALAAPQAGVVTGAVAGDYDNDGRPDLLMLNFNGQPRLYHNDGDGKFSDATRGANIPAFPYQTVSAAFADVDHDGDLDIFIAGYKQEGKPLSGAPNLLLRNNGDGKFTDVTVAAKVSGSGATSAAAVVPTDYDNRRDVDLFVVNFGAPPNLFRNLRDGTFRDVAREVGMMKEWKFFLSAAAGDVNKDGFTDFFCGQSREAGVFFISDGRGQFKVVPAPSGTEDAAVSQFLDYDNDGLLDLLTLSHGGVRVWRNVGDGWLEVSERAVAPGLRRVGANKNATGTRVLASGDVDGDGDTDFFVRDAAGSLRFGRNDGGNRNRSLGVRLAGRVSNRSGIESKVEMRAGSLWQKLEVYAAAPAPAPADLLFGLGRRERADAVRVLWPSGTVQSETEFPASAAATGVVGERPQGEPRATASAPAINPTLTVTELDRKPSSCPYLFAWNGEQFEFVTDFMGGGELGYWVAPGVRAAPDPDEYVRISGDQLKPRDGRYELRVTNELE